MIRMVVAAATPIRPVAVRGWDRCCSRWVRVAVAREAEPEGSQHFKAGVMIPRDPGVEGYASRGIWTCDDNFYRKSASVMLSPHRVVSRDRARVNRRLTGAR